ncbi:MAG: hypothetical protein J6A91_01750, partial [Bacteroidales bacterium]|nr:hypothetical protein [Bacteroidales bacterium]
EEFWVLSTNETAIMFKFFVNTNIQNICECTHIVPTFLQSGAMICKRGFANLVVYQLFRRNLI